MSMDDPAPAFQALTSGGVRMAIATPRPDQGFSATRAYRSLAKRATQCQDLSTSVRTFRIAERGTRFIVAIWNRFPLPGGEAVSDDPAASAADLILCHQVNHQKRLPRW